LDIIRRILVNYFNYDVFYVMNITDIDDKVEFQEFRCLARLTNLDSQIIQSSRKKYLFNQFKDNNKDMKPELIDLLHEKWTKYFKDTIITHATQEDPSLAGLSIDEAWNTLYIRVTSDIAFKDACLRRSEKFDMQFQQLVCAMPPSLKLQLTTELEQILSRHPIRSEMLNNH
jgi:cysteinyl-tRNA synthetase